MKFVSIAAVLAATVVGLMGASVAAFGASATADLTFHDDFQRWGWNSMETIPTPSASTSTTSKFGVIATVDELDGPIFAQPLVVPAIRSSPTARSMSPAATPERRLER